MLDAIASSNVIRMPAKASQQLAAVRRAEADLRAESSPGVLQTRRSPSTLS